MSRNVSTPASSRCEVSCRPAPMRAVEAARAGRQSEGPRRLHAATNRRPPTFGQHGPPVGPHDATILSSLPDGERDAIALAYLEGYRYAEIAETPGQPSW